MDTKIELKLLRIINEFKGMKLQASVFEIINDKLTLKLGFDDKIKGWKEMVLVLDKKTTFEDNQELYEKLIK